MGSQLVRIFIIAIMTIAAVGCGDDKKEQAYQSAGVQVSGAEYNPPQGYCAPEVVDAYNNFVVQCNSVDPSGLSVQACRFSAEHFLRNYQGISCLVVPVTYQGYGNQYLMQYEGTQVFHITDRPMRMVLDLMNQTGMGHGDFWQRRYTRWPRAIHRGHRHGRNQRQNYPRQGGGMPYADDAKQDNNDK